MCRHVEGGHITEFAPQQKGAGHAVFVLRLGQPGHCVHAVLQVYRLHAGFLQVIGDLPRLAVCALGDQHGLSGGKRRRVCLRGGSFEGNGHMETAAFSLLALDSDLPAHAVEQVLDDRHAKTGALDLVDRGRVYALKRLEDPVDEFLAHADPVVLAQEVKPYPARSILTFLVKVLGELHADKAVLLRVLHGVVDDIDKDLAQMERIADQVLLTDLPDLQMKFLMLLCRLRAHDDRDVVHHVGEGKNFLAQRHAAACDARHVEHIVDQIHQMRRGGLDLLETVEHARFFVDVREGDGCHSHDRIHRRADIVGHVRQKAARCPVLLLGGAQCVGSLVLASRSWSSIAWHGASSLFSAVGILPVSSSFIASIVPYFPFWLQDL